MFSIKLVGTSFNKTCRPRDLSCARNSSRKSCYVYTAPRSRFVSTCRL